MNKEKIKDLLKQLIKELDPNTDIDKIEITDEWGYDLSNGIYIENSKRFVIDCEYINHLK